MSGTVGQEEEEEGEEEVEVEIEDGEEEEDKKEEEGNLGEDGPEHRRWERKGQRRQNRTRPTEISTSCPGRTDFR